MRPNPIIIPAELQQKWGSLIAYINGNSKELNHENINAHLQQILKLTNDSKLITTLLEQTQSLLQQRAVLQQENLQNNEALNKFNTMNTILIQINTMLELKLLSMQANILAKTNLPKITIPHLLLFRLIKARHRTENEEDFLAEKEIKDNKREFLEGEKERYSEQEQQRKKIRFTPD